MNKLFLATALTCFTTITHANTFSIAHAQDCLALQEKQGFNIINQVGIQENLNLPNNFRIIGEFRCFKHPTLTDSGFPVFVYSFRVQIERSIKEADSQLWFRARQNLEEVAYGIGAGGDLPSIISNSTRKIIQKYRLKL